MRNEMDSVNGLLHRALSLQVAAVSPLHREDCRGMELDITRMRSLLLQYPELLECRNRNKEPPLISAIEQGHETCVKFLLENGADVENKSSHLKLNALSTALLTIDCNDTKRNIVNLLLRYGSNPDCTMNLNNQLMPLFSFLVIRNLVEYVEIFLKSGVNPNTLCNLQNGTMTCLQLAVINDRHTIVDLLIHHGADTEINNYPTYDNGLNLIQTAIKCGSVTSLICLLSNGVSLKLPVNVAYEDTHKILVVTSRSSFQTKSMMVEILYKFGYNFSEIRYELLKEIAYTREEILLHRHMETKAKNCLSLMDLSRLSILKAVGQGYIKHTDSLGMPTTLCNFLKFSDL